MKFIYAIISSNIKLLNYQVNDFNNIKLSCLFIIRNTLTFDFSVFIQDPYLLIQMCKILIKLTKKY